MSRLASVAVSVSEKTERSDSDADQVADLLEAEEELITSRPPEVIASPHAHSACSVLFRGDEVNTSQHVLSARPSNASDAAGRDVPSTAGSCMLLLGTRAERVPSAR